MIRAEHRANDGHKIVPRITPPQFTRLPWNDFIFSATYITSASAENYVDLTLGAIRSQIVSRMGLTGAPGKIFIKVVSCCAWNVANGNGLPEPFVRGTFYEIAPEMAHYSFRSDQQDHGTLNRPAKIGYFYPLRDRKEILTIDNDSLVVARISSQPNKDYGNITIRFKVLWMCTGQPDTMMRAGNDAPTETELEQLPF